MGGQTWKPEEDALLRALWPTTKAKQLAKQMRRTDSGIKQRARAIGLRKNKRRAI